MKKYSIGIDFGTLSARAMLVDIKSGERLPKDSTFTYPHGVMTSLNGKALPPDYALQHPMDYLEALEHLLREVVLLNGIEPSSVVGIGVDFTSCTVLPLDENGKPVCFDEKYANDPHAYVKLWKHHGAQKYMSKINAAIENYGKEMLNSTGGSIGSEFMIPKLYEVYAEAPEIYENTSLFINAGDYICSILGGGVPVHSVAYASIKEHYVRSLGGYPRREFFASIDEGFADVVDEKLNPDLSPVASKVGELCAEWAQKTGLCEGIAIASPIIDAQSSVAAAGFEDGKAVLVLGTSAVLASNTDKDINIKGALSNGYGSAAPELFTLESGLAAMGDLFAWFTNNAVPAEYKERAAQKNMDIHSYLCSLCENKSVGENGLIALDWWNGNRCVIQNERLSGLIVGLRLSTPPEDIYRALIEGCAYGFRRICENYEKQGIPISSMSVTGGIALKNKMLMQIFADVLKMPMELLECAQSAALGSAIYGAVAAGEYESIQEASSYMRCGIAKTYTPIAENSKIYDAIYAKYCELYDLFGNNGIMDFLFDMRK